MIENNSIMTKALDEVFSYYPARMDSFSFFMKAQTKEKEKTLNFLKDEWGYTPLKQYSLYSVDTLRKILKNKYDEKCKAFIDTQIAA